MPRTSSLAARLLAPLADPRRFAAGLALVFGITAVGLLATPPRTLAWDSGTFSAASESMLISLQNQARASAGLKSLKLDTELRKVARWRSKDMVERNYFSHTIKGTDRKVFWYMQTKYDYCFKLGGENMGTVTWEGATVEEATNWVFNAFMDSSGHRANIMGKAWDVVAVGAYKGPGSQFMWTVLFADRCGSTAPRATPKPTPRATPKPKPKATPKPAPRATPKPKPTVTPAPAWTPFVPARTEDPIVEPVVLPTAPPTEPPPPPQAAAPAPGALRVVDRPPDRGFVDTILLGVTARFFGS